MSTQLIPEFKVGQKVKVHLRTYEMLCPVCGKIMIEPGYADDFEGIIIPFWSTMRHTRDIMGGCGALFPIPDGFISVQSGEDEIAVPWTMVELVDPDEEV